MGNTADLAMVQKMIIDTLQKEGRSQRAITERGGCSRSAVSKQMQSWLEGRHWVGKCAQATEMTASLRILSSKADSNTWESFTRSELKLDSVHQESPRSDIFRKRATKPLLKQKHQGHNQGLESGGRLERHRIQAAWSPVWSFWSLWWFGVSWRLLVLVRCVFQVQSQCSHLPGYFRTLYASFCWQALWRCWFPFPAGL